MILIIMTLTFMTLTDKWIQRWSAYNISFLFLLTVPHKDLMYVCTRYSILWLFFFKIKTLIFHSMIIFSFCCMTFIYYNLKRYFQLSLDMHYTEDEIYELSLAREPRNSLSSVSMCFYFLKAHYQWLLTWYC